MSRHGCLVPARARLPDHRHQRHHARAASEQQNRRRARLPPDEPAADRAAQLELIAHLDVVGEVWGYLSVVQMLDGHLGPSALGPRRADRIAALRPVAVRGGEPEVRWIVENGVPVGVTFTDTESGVRYDGRYQSSVS
jgi:hypothetical protein